ncbi:uncharacterized protein [Hetaerina americana]|uniref:uncharacterized protein n=1 Tax=Hetaerina americana TaxID=62018 RepID=UPI003A7F1FA0
MDEEPNALPWISYRDYYYISLEDLESIGTNSCFRVRCKLCAPALKTIGTNRSSSSNLRKHMKCIHPEALEEMDRRSLNVLTRGKKRRSDPQEGILKRFKRELLGGERELLFQLVEEYTAALECGPDDEDLADRRKLMWKSLSSTFNEISGGPEFTPEELKSTWETLNGGTNGGDENDSKIGPRIMTTCSMKLEKNNESYSGEEQWENAVTSDEPEIELVDDISRPIIMADEGDTFASMEIGYQEESTNRQNSYQQGRDFNSKQADLKKRAEIELKIPEKLMGDHKVRMEGLKQQMDLKKEILKEELKHQRKLKQMEFAHIKLMNNLERSMKQEAFRAEERRKEEKHAVEMSILRMSVRQTSQMRCKIPGTFRGYGSLGSKMNSSSTEGTQNNVKVINDEQSSSLSGDKQRMALGKGKIIVLKRPLPDRSVDIVRDQSSSLTAGNEPEEVCGFSKCSGK